MPPHPLALEVVIAAEVEFEVPLSASSSPCMTMGCMLMPAGLALNFNHLRGLSCCGLPGSEKEAGMVSPCTARTSPLYTAKLLPGLSPGLAAFCSMPAALALDGRRTSEGRLQLLLLLLLL